MQRGELQRLSSVTIRLLCENTARGIGVIGEHGLSWWIEVEGKRVLFDLGQGLGLFSNAGRLGIDIESVDAIAISHGHYDHVGAWAQMPAKAKASAVYIHPDAVRPKYHRGNGGAIELVSNERFSRTLRSEAGRVVDVRSPTEVVKGLWMTGEIPRITDYEDTGGAFFSDAEGNCEDALLDDQALFFDTELGVVVILGCAHSGLINTLRYVRELTGRRIHAVVGGMHLLHASSVRLERTLADLEAIDPDWVGGNHCTGGVAQARLMTAYEGRYLECHAGQRIRFPRFVRGGAKVKEEPSYATTT
ncbi:metallo-beta-lactamase superfamily protein [Verrucomicrobiia bacterium DG1235]|nr:metallo-beta-lactamase superfamily protein [Verrucomicrobiae bacterium DG1235]